MVCSTLPPSGQGSSSGSYTDGPILFIVLFLIVWCWGWDGAGDIEGPDVEPVWEPLKNSTGDPRLIRHDRGFSL